MLYLIRPLERHVRRHLGSELNRRRFDRAKRFVDETQKRGVRDETALRVHVRWLWFLCRQTSVQRDMWLADIDFLRKFATLFGLSPAESREFVDLSLLGELWRRWCFNDLYKGPPELVARHTRVRGWEHFERRRRDGAGLIVLQVHNQFARFPERYLLHRGHDSIAVGLTNDRLEAKGFRTPPEKQFELARQMHAAKQLLARGGLVRNLPDARQNLDNSRVVEFFGRKRQLAAGFAELALKTGARVVPVAYRFSPRGHFVMEFGGAFDVPGPGSSHDERVDSLVGQYATFLRDEWRRYPWNIHWDQLRYYCQLPEVDPGEMGDIFHPSAARSDGAEEKFAQ